MGFDTIQVWKYEVYVDVSCAAVNQDIKTRAVVPFSRVQEIDTIYQLSQNISIL